LRTTQPAATIDLVHDTLNGLSAFVEPGPDAYSAAQGVSTTETGAIAALVTEIFIPVLDGSVPFVPNFSAVVAGILNQLALAVNPSPVGPFNSPFANLSFNEKVVVFQIMDATDSLKPLAGVLLAFAAYICYSEARGADTVGRLVGRDLKTAMSNVDKLLYIEVFTDDDVEAQNRVTLSSNIPPDEHGQVPRIEIHYRNRSARTIRNREYLV